jgi:hypothetical protein
MSTTIPLTEVRENLSELVNQAYYEDRMFGITKGKKFMGTFIGGRVWKDIIRAIEKHEPGLADTLALMADPDLQRLLTDGEKNIREGTTISWGQVGQDIEHDK